eukprot:jgi/Mesen1/3655/ME000200S02731
MAQERRPDNDRLRAVELLKNKVADCDNQGDASWKALTVCQWWHSVDKSCLVGTKPWDKPLCPSSSEDDYQLWHVMDEELLAMKEIDYKHKGVISADDPELKALMRRLPVVDKGYFHNCGWTARWAVDTPPAKDGQIHVLFGKLPCARYGCCALPWMLRPNSTDLLSAKAHFLKNEYGMLIDLPFNPEYILDAGGVGMAPVFFALVWPEAKILRVEPHITNFEAGYRNSMRHETVKQHNMGLWDKAIELQMCSNVHVYWGPDWPFNSSQEQAFFTREPTDPPCEQLALDSMRVSRLEDVMRANNFPRFDLIKMDIEGAEVQVFREPGMKRILANTQVFIGELHTWVPGAHETVHRAFAEIGGFLHFHFDENDVWIRSSMFKC